MGEPNAFWRNVLWPEGTKIETLGHNDKRYVWMSKGEAFEPKNTEPASKHGAGSREQQ